MSILNIIILVVIGITVFDIIGIIIALKTNINMPLTRSLLGILKPSNKKEKSLWG